MDTKLEALSSARRLDKPSISPLAKLESLTRLLEEYARRLGEIIYCNELFYRERQKGIERHAVGM
jgi:hypothetical protein